ncbi:sulfotransferase family protein [Coralloluteibacterium stylophorae]|uniref:Sulfotransferase n=1 Tax=Coralloluteibacterium stylophorae TaxID=1776034 RepID=A0A8J8B036_9GAMM|nr:sulfotransferase [Coralloluteibacterium stylophorae]MBS7457828.1 sulfotransferase [Coralloluteibacterium stylophorae]
MSEPRVRFVIGGVQKGGTTALATYLSAHPGVALPATKEAHVFDMPDFDESLSQAAVDRLYAPHFAGAPRGALCGDATPIYVFHRRFLDRIARYNPAMRWIVILRHPVERAVSHYHMERGRGWDRWPFWPAMLLERWRLRGHEDDFSEDSPLRRYSYRARGSYVRQLDALHALFPREQVLVLRNEDLASSPIAMLDQVHRFLRLPAHPLEGAPRRIFEGGYAPISSDSLAWRILAAGFRGELEQLRRRYGIRFDGTDSGG